jgi:DNA polymerase-1
MSKEKIILIDGSSYFFRAFYGVPRLTNSKGFPTNAIYGFINMLLKVLEKEKESKVAIIFDTPKPTFRKELYPEYKSNRQAPPEDLVKQIPHILKAVDAFNVLRLDKEGFEADDVIATLTRIAKEKGYLIEIITGDKDLAQLVDDSVVLYDSMKDRRLDENGVYEKFQVRPNQITDLLSLMGDSSDNIPGVTGIGEKTATELIRTFGSLEAIYDNIEEIKQVKRKETLIKEREMAFLSKKLATVHENVPIDIDFEKLDYRGPNLSKLKPFCEEMEFNNILKKFSIEGEKKEQEKIAYECVDTIEKLDKLVKKLEKVDLIALDTETTSLRIHDAELVGISISTKSKEGYYIPVRHLYGEQIELETIREKLKPLLENPKLKKVGQNIKYDIQILKNFGIEVAGVYSDTMLLSYLIDPETAHGLDALAQRFLDYKTISYDEVTEKKKLLFNEVSLDKATAYAAEDADITMRLQETLYPKILENKLESICHTVEIPLLEVLGDMEYRGVLMNQPELLRLEKKISQELTTQEKIIYEHAGGPFNINSPKQLSQILFEKLALPVIRKTKTGVSTDESVLLELKSKHPICEDILKFRELGKLQSTYINGLSLEISKKTGRIHTSYNQTVAATGRLSSSNPNLQNIPTNKNYDIRTLFIAPEGSLLFSADYSQIELRILAEMSGDKALRKAFEDEEDIHNYTASLVFGHKEVSDQERKIGKTINFGVVYGQTPFGLSQMLKISPSEAKKFIDLFFEKYSGVKKFYESLLDQARKTGETRTLMGRRRLIGEINSQNRMRREMAERAAINSPIQGTAADMIKLAMIRIFNKISEEKLQSKMIMQVHDELIFEVVESEKEKIKNLVKFEMENAFKFSTPIKVETGFGKNWSEC